MGSVSGEKDAAYAIAVHHPYVGTVKGEPGGVVQANLGPVGALVDDLLKALERWLIRLIGGYLCLKLKGIGGGKRAQGDPSVFVPGPGMPMVAVEYVHLDVADQHAFVFPGFSFEAYVEVFAQKASPSVCGEDVLRCDLVRETVPLHGGGHGCFVLFDGDEFGCEFDVVPQDGQVFSQNLFDAELRNDENACIGDFGRGVSAFVRVEIAEDGGAVVAAEGQVEASVGEDLVDDAQVIQEFETAGLESFSPLAGEVGWGLVDDAEWDAAACQVTGQG